MVRGAEAMRTRGLGSGVYVIQTFGGLSVRYLALITGLLLMMTIVSKLARPT